MVTHLRFYWPQMKKFVREWCRNCTKCVARKPPQRKSKAALQRYALGEPLERVAIDVIGPFPASRDGNRYIVVIGNYFTKWVEVVATPDQEVKTVTEVVMRQFPAKLQARLLRPCVVTERVNKVMYKIQVARDTSMILHFDLMKPFYGAEIRLWAERRRTRAMQNKASARQKIYDNKKERKARRVEDSCGKYIRLGDGLLCNQNSVHLN